MQRKFMMILGSLLMVFLLGACRQGNEDDLNNEATLIDVPMFECPTEYLNWIAEQEFEITLSFEDLDGNPLSEEELLIGSWETVSIFPLQLSLKDATLLITSKNDLAPIAVNFHYKFMENTEENINFLEEFSQLVEFTFSDFVPDREGNSVDLLIWADTALNDFAFVESSMEVEQPVIERTFFKSSLQEEEGFIIYNWLDLSGAYLRNGFVFTDNDGVKRFFVFGFDNNQENDEELILIEVEIEDEMEVPEVEQPSREDEIEVPEIEQPSMEDEVEVPEVERPSTEETTPPTANAPTPPIVSLPTTHTVQPGETLFSIAQHFGVSVAQIQQANNMGTSTDISVGQQLNINNDPVAPPPPPQAEAPVSTPAPPPPANPQTVVSVAFRANAGTNFSRIHAFNGSAFGIEGRDTDIVIWANGILRDFQVHLGADTHRMGDIAVGEAVNIQTLISYFATSSSTTISFVNDGGVREVFIVTDMFGPGADQAGLIPTLG